MKKISSGNFSFLIAIFLFLPSSLFAGSFNEWGVKFGGSISNQNINSKTIEIDRDLHSYFGFNIDCFVNIIDGKKYNMIAQIGYAQKGCVESITFTFIDPVTHDFIDGPPINLESKTDYLSLYLLGKIDYNFKNLNPYIILGPRIDFLINAQSESLRKNVYEKLKDQNWGLSIGIGNEVELVTSLTMLIEVQYNHDFEKIYDTKFLSIEKNSFEFKIGFSF